MAMKAKHAFGNLSDVQKALNEGKIDSYDILFLDGDTAPKIGWIDSKGVFRLVENESDFSELEAIIATKASIEDVQAIEGQITAKADATRVDELETELATKVTVDEVDALVEEKVNEKVEEINLSYQIIEF